MEFPFEKIGESGWNSRLTELLLEYDIEVEDNSTYDVPYFPINDEVKLYYSCFGGLESNDFMYNLKKADEIVFIGDSEWEFLSEVPGFEENRSCDIVISESLSGDPLCINRNDGKLYLYKHDPLGRFLLFDTMSQFVKYEIVNLLELMGEISLGNRSEKLAFNRKYLPCDDADYDVRIMSL